MGQYSCSTNDILDAFESFLTSQEGEISAEAIAGAWNKLAKEHGWIDRLYAKSNNGWSRFNEKKKED